MAVMKVLLHPKLILPACFFGALTLGYTLASTSACVTQRDLPGLFHNNTWCVCQQSISGESLRHQKKRARSWNHEDSTGSTKTFSRVANGVLLTTNGLQMFQTKKPFWIPTITSSLSVIKKKKKQSL